MLPGKSSEGDHEVVISVGPVHLSGRLTIPEGASGMVVFAHGSGSSRHSPRNRFVADVLQRSGLGTLLFDLLTADEERDRANVFDIELLAGRLVEVTKWLASQPAARPLPFGYFGASTGAAAALWAAAESDGDVGAVVSRGGRPDLAGPRLPAVTAPTLLIVGGYDPAVLDLNREAQDALRCENRLTVVPGATHLFEEPGTLEEVAELARDWFIRHLAPRRPTSMRSPSGPDPFLEHAREQADGAAVYADPFADEALLVAREEAQGIEVFVDPDEVIPATALREGAPGHEALVADQIGLGRNDDEESRDTEEWEEG